MADRAARWLLPEENPEGTVYGMIAIGALLAAESGRYETYLETALSALIASLIYWLAHAYSSVLGRRLEDRRALTPRTLYRGLVRDWAIIRGAAIPLVALGVGWAAGASQQTGVNLALWSVVVSLIAFELIAGIRARASARELMLEAGVGAILGLGVLALRIVLH